MTEQPECTCEAPAGAVHNKGCPLAIWTPKEKLDGNTQRMAWLLFLESWKAHVRESGVAALNKHAEETYGHCLAVAKIVRAGELEAGGS